MKLEVSAAIRQTQGTSASRRLRRQGLVPGIVYGGNVAPQLIELVHNDLVKLLKVEAFHASLLTLNLGKVQETVLLRDIQMHPYKAQVYHIDFQRIDPNKEITMRVPLHFVNAENAPGVKTSGATINHVLNDIEIRCLPKDLPESITVDLSSLEANRSLHVSDVQWPAGVKPVIHGVEDQTIVTCFIVGEMSEGEDSGLSANDSAE